MLNNRPHGKNRIGIAAKVPDSITSWRLTAFSISSEKGLGLTKNPGHVSYKYFFLKLHILSKVFEEGLVKG